jgi:hypothetical protein
MNTLYGIIGIPAGVYSFYEVFRGLATGDLSVAWNFRSETYSRKGDAI